MIDDFCLFEKILRPTNIVFGKIGAEKMKFIKQSLSSNGLSTPTTELEFPIRERFTALSWGL